MSIDELERSGIIKKLPTDRKKVNDSLDLARRDMNIARNMLDGFQKDTAHLRIQVMFQQSGLRGSS